MKIRIEQYEQAADEKVSIGGIKWLKKWDVCVQCDSREEAEALKARLAEKEQEPVAWMYIGIRHDGTTHGPHLCWKPEYMDVVSASKGAVAAPLYASPPKHEYRIKPVRRTDRQIVDQTEELAVRLLSWFYDHDPDPNTLMRESSHPFAERCWAAACHIQEMLTATDPENSVVELDVCTTPQKQDWVGLTDEEIRNEANHHVFDESFFNGAVWARGKIKEKNNG